MENQEQTQGTQENLPQLTVSDLNNIRTVLDVAIRRGAFSGSEISAVGATFDKLNAFINAVQPKAEETPEQK